MNRTNNLHNNLAFSAQSRILVENIILQGLKRKCPVYLDGLGVLIPQENDTKMTSVVGGKTLSYTQPELKIKFEKSFYLDSKSYEKFGKNLIEAKEIAEAIVAKLPEGKNTRALTKQLIHAIKAFFTQVRSELLTSGKSEQLKKIGVFYALKLQENLDWQTKFSIADILLIQTRIKTGDATQCYSFPTPVLKNNLEVVTACYDRSFQTEKIDLPTVLDQLGFATKLSPEQSSLGLNFYRSDTNLVISTHNLHRIFSGEQSTQKGVEFLLQFSLSSFTTSVCGEFATERVLSAAKYLLGISCLLLFSSLNKTLNAGTMLEYNFAELNDDLTQVAGVLLTKPAWPVSGYRTLDSSFSYLNVVGLTQSELDFAAKFSPRELTEVLCAKSASQVTKLASLRIF